MLHIVTHKIKVIEKKDKNKEIKDIEQVSEIGVACVTNCYPDFVRRQVWKRKSEKKRDAAALKTFRTRD